MDTCQLDVGFFTETKLTDDHYTKQAEGYHFYSTMAKSPHQGGVGIFYRNDKDLKWHLESIKAYGPNVMSAYLVCGEKRWNLVGAYIPPSETDGTTIHHIMMATTRDNKQPVIFLGDLNANLDEPKDERDTEIMAMTAAIGLSDLAKAFKGGRNSHNSTWSMAKKGRREYSVVDYILTDAPRKLFTSIQRKQPAHFHSDHRLLRTDIILDKPEQEKV